MVKGTDKKADRREFEYTQGDQVEKYYLGMPSSDILRKAEWHYSKVYNKALIDGIATEAEMMDILRKRGIIGEAHDAKVEEIQLAVATGLIAMETEKDPIKKRELALEVFKSRRELFNWNQRITGPLSSTCERMAEDAKAEYLTSAVVQRKDGARVWESYDSFLDEEDQSLSLTARYEVLLWMQGLDSDFLDNTPENLVLLSKEDEVSEPAQLDAHKEDAEEEPTVEDEPEQKSTKARRKGVAK